MKRKSQVRNHREGVQALSLGHGKRARLHRLLFGAGPANGTLMVLPLDPLCAWAPTPWATRCTWARRGRTWRSASTGRYARTASAWACPSSWAYPRGSAIDAKGGKGSLFAQDYAARVALEMGADIVKLQEPVAASAGSPEPYASLREDAPARLVRVVRSAGRVMVLFSGGEKDDREERVLEKIRLYMECGATGVMFGRNMWLRKPAEALSLVGRVHHGPPRPMNPPVGQRREERTHG